MRSEFLLLLWLANSIKTLLPSAYQFFDSIKGTGIGELRSDTMTTIIRIRAMERGGRGGESEHDDDHHHVCGFFLARATNSREMRCDWAWPQRLCSSQQWLKGDTLYRSRRRNSSKEDTICCWWLTLCVFNDLRCRRGAQRERVDGGGDDATRRKKRRI